ncbi:hypothetical protein NQZ68_037075 [Dissostichus eleginoides]|nr:hypothetical protein NQZ68_037075 [Dissostichus eleginoides]
MVTPDHDDPTQEKEKKPRSGSSPMIRSHVAAGGVGPEQETYRDHGTKARRKEVFPRYHTRDYSTTGGKMKRINKEKIEFLQPLQECQPMNQ